MGNWWDRCGVKICLFDWRVSLFRRYWSISEFWFKQNYSTGFWEFRRIEKVGCLNFDFWLINSFSADDTVKRVLTLEYATRVRHFIVFSSSKIRTNVFIGWNSRILFQLSGQSCSTSSIRSIVLRSAQCVSLDISHFHLEIFISSCQTNRTYSNAYEIRWYWSSCKWIHSFLDFLLFDRWI